MTKRYWKIDLEEMIKAGVHLGHGTRKWNPRMAPYISAKRKGIHITNLTRTARFLSEACNFVFDAASRGKRFNIVGTEKEVASSVASAAIRARLNYVNKKWIGGMLTNWSTTERRLYKFRDLRAEQKTGKLNRLPKKDAAILKRQLSHLQRYLGGIKYHIMNNKRRLDLDWYLCVTRSAHYFASPRGSRFVELPSGDEENTL